MGGGGAGKARKDYAIGSLLIYKNDTFLFAKLITGYVLSCGNANVLPSNFMSVYVQLSSPLFDESYKPLSRHLAACAAKFYI